MAINIHNDVFVDTARGRIHGATIVHKFGHNDGIGTTFEPITDNGVYQTPTSLTSLELVSTDVNDTSAGTGARSVYIEGIGANWELIFETVITNGTTAVALANQYYRIFRMYVVSSGTYATQAAGSHVGDIVLRVASAGEEWAKIDSTAGFPLGQTEIGAYCVPLGKVAYVKSIHIHVDSGKTVDITAFQRPDANVVSAPYSAMKTWGQYHGVSGHTNIHPDTPFGPFPECTDLGFMGRVASGSGAALIDFEILLFDR